VVLVGARPGTRCARRADPFGGKNRQFVIDFAGTPLDAWKAETPPAMDVGTDKGKIVNAVAEENPDTGGWRISIELDTQNQKVVEVHARFIDDKTPLSETWIARWTPS
jgi:glucans biosynthesis protein